MNFNFSDALQVVMLLVFASTMLSSGICWTAIKTKKAGVA